MANERFVLFDFDGVIVDSFEIASALAKRVCALNTPERYRSLFEGNIYKQFDKMEPHERHEHGPDCETTLDWWEEYKKSGAHDAHSFPGVVDAVKALAKEYRLVIISSGHGEMFIKPAIKKHGIEACFLDVLGAEVHTNKAIKIAMVFEKYGVSADRCVFVTDTLGDLREAAEQRVGGIAVSWGFHAPETLEKEHPFRIVDSAPQLTLAVRDYFAQ